MWEHYRSLATTHSKTVYIYTYICTKYILAWMFIVKSLKEVINSNINSKNYNMFFPIQIIYSVYSQCFHESKLIYTNILLSLVLFGTEKQISLPYAMYSVLYFTTIYYSQYYIKNAY